MNTEEIKEPKNLEAEIRSLSEREEDLKEAMENKTASKVNKSNLIKNGLIGAAILGLSGGLIASVSTKGMTFPELAQKIKEEINLDGELEKKADKKDLEDVKEDLISNKLNVNEKINQLVKNDGYLRKDGYRVNKEIKGLKDKVSKLENSQRRDEEAIGNLKENIGGITYDLTSLKDKISGANGLDWAVETVGKLIDRNNSLSRQLTALENKRNVEIALWQKGEKEIKGYLNRLCEQMGSLRKYVYENVGKDSWYGSDICPWGKI